jgi:hypothetical protein
MLKLEEYIEKRKSEDCINEFDSSQKINNIRICIDYIFEYYDQYLPLQGTEKRTVAENEKLQKYEKTLKEYSENIIIWLVSIYDTYDKQINKSVSSYLNSIDGFYLIYEEAEFRSISYDCYAALIKKAPFLKNQTELLYQFIREYHNRETAWKNKYDPQISDSITNWLKNTLLKYNVSITGAIESYLTEFGNNPGSWPPRCRIKSESSFSDYDYNYKVKNNLFNINTFYSKYANKPFIKGKKTELEMVMMYIWSHNMADDVDYWNKYLLQVDE